MIFSFNTSVGICNEVERDEIRELIVKLNSHSLVTVWFKAEFHSLRSSIIFELFLNYYQLKHKSTSIYDSQTRELNSANQEEYFSRREELKIFLAIKINVPF